MPAVDPIRELLDRLWRADAERTVASWRGSPARPDRERAILATLAAPRTQDQLGEQAERDGWDDEHRAAVASHLADAARAAGLARAAPRLDDAWAEPVVWDSRPVAPASLLDQLALDPGRRRDQAAALARGAARWADAARAAQADVEEALEAVAWLDVPASAAVDDAATLLDETDDLAEELVARLAHRRVAEARRADDLWVVLREAGRLGLGPENRWRRLAGHLAPLGLQAPLAARAAVGGRATTRSTIEAPVVLELGPPRTVRLAAPAWSLGLTSELAAAEGVGRALALTLAHPSLPPVHTVPRAATVSRAFGALLAGLHATPRFLADALGRRGPEADALGLAALANVVLSARTAAAISLARPALSGARTRGPEDAAVEHLSRALTVEVPGALAVALVATPVRHPDARLRALRVAPAIHVALRERFDDDWYRNPRVAPLLRGAAERGERLTVEAWADELDADPAATYARWRELSP